MDTKHEELDADIIHTTTREASVSQLKGHKEQRGEKLDLVYCQFCYSDCNIHYETRSLARIRLTMIRARIQTSSEAESPNDDD